ncbi:hypothetical protein [Bradyrhizobium sp. Arg816]|uniref:hypothetical protein n=1 Tax=Bradyrhizobium sp. Arg816 TaxID=2998491 RepID=UPI00249E1362|nr:hypothetical protein [Bradyrhizobium sp. Arg816]MDI3567208.1 hypothetical protein [Bradyrhizobium sp. Arg816]
MIHVFVVPNFAHWRDGNQRTLIVVAPEQIEGTSLVVFEQTRARPFDHPMGSMSWMGRLVHVALKKFSRQPGTSPHHAQRCCSSSAISYKFDQIIVALITLVAIVD